MLDVPMYSIVIKIPKNISPAPKSFSITKSPMEIKTGIDILIRSLKFFMYLIDDAR